MKYDLPTEMVQEILNAYVKWHNEKVAKARKENDGFVSMNTNPELGHAMEFPYFLKWLAENYFDYHMYRHQLFNALENGYKLVDKTMR